MSTLKELHKALDDENISYAELAELDTMAANAGITVTEEMTAIDTLIALEDKTSNELLPTVRELSLYADNTYDLYKYIQRIAEKYRDKKYTSNQFDTAIKRYVSSVATSYRKEFSLNQLTNGERMQLSHYFADAVRCWEF